MSSDPFAERRAALMQTLDDGAILVAAGHEVIRNGDVEYPFRQLSTFWYLTGFDEPDAVALLRPGHELPYTLFVRPHDPDMAIWVGPRAGVEGARNDFAADLAFAIATLEDELPSLLDGVETLYLALGEDDRLDALATDLVAERRAGAQRNATVGPRIVDPTPAIDRLRLLKSDTEVAALQRAIEITGNGLEAAMRATRPGLHEYEVQAILESAYRREGSLRDGFPAIVAAGEHSCTLHYTANRARINDGDLLLLDTGAEHDCYSADVTRTIPANGKFSAEQRAVYDIVLAAQQAGIEATAPGVGFHDVHAASLRVLVEGLIDLAVIKGSVDEAIETKSYRPYYMHSTSHWLGLDVHDVGPYRLPRNRSGEDDEDDEAPTIPLEPGMVLTVEPGLYLGSQLEDVPESLRGIGVRIEDDVLVTPDGYRNLSAGIPSDPEELETIVGTA